MIKCNIPHCANKPSLSATESGPICTERKMVWYCHFHWNEQFQRKTLDKNKAMEILQKTREAIKKGNGHDLIELSEDYAKSGFPWKKKEEDQLFCSPAYNGFLKKK